MWQWHMRVGTWVGAYFSAVSVFAVVYFLLPAGQFSQPLSLLDAFYFSVITITTTGFGDIAAHGAAAKLLVSLEATLGLAVAGLFLASLWRDFTLRVEAAHETRLRHGTRAVGLATLFVHWRYIEATILEYRNRSAAVTTALVRRDGTPRRPSAAQATDAPHRGAATADVTGGEVKPLLARYFEAEDRLESDLKYLLANTVLMEIPDLRDLLISLLSLLRANDAREALTAMSEVRLQAEVDTSHAASRSPGCDGRAAVTPGALLAQHVRHATEALDGLTAAMSRLMAAPQPA
jgi:hypothetical protein